MRNTEEFAGCQWVEERAIEVGNIFKLGVRFTKPFDMLSTGKDGERSHVLMGCYGIGPSRVMGTIVEVHHDDRGIVWPESVAPFAVHMLVLGTDEAVRAEAEKLYAQLTANRVEVLLDDRSTSNGAKLMEADLIGIPTRIIVSAKTLSANSVELKRRSEKQPSLVAIEGLADHLGARK